LPTPIDPKPHPIPHANRSHPAFALLPPALAVSAMLLGLPSRAFAQEQPASDGRTSASMFGLASRSEAFPDSPGECSPAYHRGAKAARPDTPDWCNED